MKFATALVLAAIIVINGPAVADSAALASGTRTDTGAAMPEAAIISTATNANAAIISPQEAFVAVKDTDLPDGVTLTGTAEPLKQPAADALTTTDHHGEIGDHQSGSEGAQEAGADSDHTTSDSPAAVSADGPTR
ncbi:hypothetical protein FI667_g6033, partial [Globisporangium splendens]